MDRVAWKDTCESKGKEILRKSERERGGKRGRGRYEGERGRGGEACRRDLKRKEDNSTPRDSSRNT